MGLFDIGTPSTLADVLGQQADTASLGIQNDYATQRRKAAAVAGANGRLRSGVQNYTTGDINAGELTDLGQVQSSLADALSGIPSQDYIGIQQNNRNMQLAQLIAELNKPSALQETIGAMRGGANSMGSVAAFF